MCKTAVPIVQERYHLIYYKHLTWHLMKQYFYNNQEQYVKYKGNRENSMERKRQNYIPRGLTVYLRSSWHWKHCFGGWNTLQTYRNQIYTEVLNFCHILSCNIQNCYTGKLLHWQNIHGNLQEI